MRERENDMRGDRMTNTQSEGRKEQQQEEKTRRVRTDGVASSQDRGKTTRNIFKKKKGRKKENDHSNCWEVDFPTAPPERGVPADFYISPMKAAFGLKGGGASFCSEPSGRALYS